MNTLQQPRLGGKIWVLGFTAAAALMLTTTVQAQFSGEILRTHTGRVTGARVEAVDAALGTNEGSYEILENGAGKFKVEVTGLVIDSFEIESVDIDPMVVDYHVVDVPNPLGGAFRVYGPGDAHFGSITIRARVGASSNELYQWWLDTSRGQNIRKSISVIVLKRDGSTEARRYNFHECFPTSYSASDPTTGEAPTDTFQFSIGGADLDGGGGDVEIFQARRRGLYAILWDPGTAPEPLAAWASWGGGEPANFQNSVGTDQFHTSTPGHKYVDTLTLRGPLTSGRKALCQWITATVQGRPWKQQVVIKEILRDGTAGKTTTYIDCFPTRYVFPALSASGTGNLREEVTIKPIRLTLN